MLGEAASAVLAAEQSGSLPPLRQKRADAPRDDSGDDEFDGAAVLAAVKDAAPPAAVRAPVLPPPRAGIVHPIAIPRASLPRQAAPSAPSGRGSGSAIRGTVVSAAPDANRTSASDAPIPPEMAALRSPKEDLVGAESFYGYVEGVEDAILVVEVCRRGLLPRVKRRLGDRERALIRPGSVFVFIEREAMIRRWTDGKIWSPSRISGEFLIYRQLETRLGGDGPESDTAANERAPSSVVKADGLVKKTISLNIGEEYFHLVCYYCDGDRAKRDELARLSPSRNPFFAPIRAQGGLSVPRNLVAHSSGSASASRPASSAAPPQPRRQQVAPLVRGQPSIVTVSPEALAAYNAGGPRPVLRPSVQGYVGGYANVHLYPAGYAPRPLFAPGPPPQKRVFVPHAPGVRLPLPVAAAPAGLPPLRAHENGVLSSSGASLSPSEAPSSPATAHGSLSGQPRAASIASLTSAEAESDRDAASLLLLCHFAADTRGASSSS